MCLRAGEVGRWPTSAGAGGKVGLLRYMYTCMLNVYIYIYICTYIHTYNVVCMCYNLYYIYIYTYIHVYIYIYIYRLASAGMSPGVELSDHCL